MSMSINALAVNEGHESFYDPRFHQMLETYMDYLRKHPGTVTLNLSPHDVYKYQGDWAGLLNNLKIPWEYHWAILRINGFANVCNVDQELSSILVPDLSVLDNIRQFFLQSA